MLCNAIAAGLIVESNMNSEENDGNNQGKAEVKMDGIGLKNDNQSMDQGAVTSKVQLENGAAVEELKLNNNSNDIKLVLPSVKTSVFSNGTKTIQAPISDCANSLEQNVSQDMSNVNISSMFTSTANIKPQAANTNAVNCQLKLKTVTNASTLNLPKSQMHLNLSSTHVNMHLNHNSSAVLNSTTTTSAMLHSSVSILNAPLMPPNLSTSKPNDDIDMKNNVDYASAIEKCPSKVSCSSDSSPEADSSWTSKSYGSKRVLNNIGGSIGSTSQGTCCFLRPNINGSREVAGPSGIQRVSFYIVNCIAEYLYRILRI